MSHSDSINPEVRFVSHTAQKFFEEMKAERRAAYKRKRTEERIAREKAYRKKERLGALAAYGGKCACCGEEDYRFLCIDHINNDGAEHRKKIKGTIFSWLRKNNYPEGFQVLCWNCNMGKYHNGGICPHKDPLDE